MAFGGFFFLGMIDNVMMNYYLGYTAVGIYSAYYTIFSIFGGKILATISNVLYPTASTYNNTAVLFRKIIRGLPKISIAVFIFIILAITVLFRIYGNAYPFSWILTILMAFNVVIYTAIVLLGNIIGSRGVYGTRFLAVATIAAGIINVLLNAALIPSFKLIGVMMATTIASAFLLYSYWRWLRVKSQEVVPSSDLA
jgi:O-antigen/teichoic acid export membrane protein